MSGARPQRQPAERPRQRRSHEQTASRVQCHFARNGALAGRRARHSSLGVAEGPHDTRTAALRCGGSLDRSTRWPPNDLVCPQTEIVRSREALAPKG